LGNIGYYDLVLRHPGNKRVIDRILKIMIGIAAGLVIIPEPVTIFLTEGILSIKDFIGSLAEG
jgi:hypothetical protein